VSDNGSRKKIYVFRASKHGEGQGIAYGECGKRLSVHYSSSYGWFQHDMGLKNSDWHHEEYEQYAPHGYDLFEVIGFAELYKVLPHLSDLNLDVSADEARALHRVVRAMHDGHCPKCGYLGPAQYFWADEKPHPSLPEDEGRHECPVCHFYVTETEARGALMAFKPYLNRSVEVFEEWRSKQGGQS
jgi:hypothetical protein